LPSTSATRFPAHAGWHASNSAAASQKPRNKTPVEFMTCFPETWLLAHQPVYQNPVSDLVTLITHRKKTPAAGALPRRLFPFKIGPRPKQKGRKRCAALYSRAIAGWN
jgi:hypothetical protein